MVTLQILNKVLENKDFSIIESNGLGSEYFQDYSDEYQFIEDHYRSYGVVCDKETFIKQFPDFAFIEVNEPDDYLIQTVREEYLYSKTVPVIQKAANLLKDDSRQAVEFLTSSLTDLPIHEESSGVNIISEAKQRLDLYEYKQQHKDTWMITTGFPELDTIVGGWDKGEDFVILFARTGQGKSWVLAKTLTHAWQIGYRVGYISPEMSAIKIGYRFDTLLKNFSNKDLLRGNEIKEYHMFINELSQNSTPFIVKTPKDFGKRITITKLRTFIQANKLDILGIDGITYLADERSKKGDSKTITLTNISEDLMSLSLELGVPILAVVQSNRSGVKESAEDVPDIENIRDSDGIAYNASKIISLKQQGPGLKMVVKKNREGASGGSLLYRWDIDKGLFEYIPDDTDDVDSSVRESTKQSIKQAYKDGADVF